MKTLQTKWTALLRSGGGMRILWMVLLSSVSPAQVPETGWLKQLQSPDLDSQREALIQLATSLDPRIPDACLPLLKSPGTSIRRNAARAIGSRWHQIPKERTATFVEALKVNLNSPEVGLAVGNDPPARAFPHDRESPSHSTPMKTVFLLPVAIICSLAALISSASAEADIAALKDSAEKGSAEAQTQLGDAYQTGKGVARDSAEALKWYVKAAGQGHADAQFRLGNIYAYGPGIPRNAAEALKWNRKAAEQGHAKAQFNVGVELLEGDMENRDPAESFKWLRKAAEQDLAIAQYYAGFLQVHGAGRPKDVGEGLKWLNKAAEQGEPHAQYQLGNMHLEGEDVPKDTVTGLKYLNLAAMNAGRVPEGETAWDDLRKLEKEITPETFASGREEAVRWARDAAGRSLPEGQYVVRPAWNLPAGIKTLPVNGYPMAYLERGAGSTLVLVHGALNDCRYWEPQLGSLSSDRRVVSVSLRHHFPEPWNGKEGNYSIKIHAEDLARFIEALGAGPVDLVGHSRGGAVAAMMALARPDLVRKLVLAEPAILSLIPAAAGAQARAEGVKQLNARFAKGEIESTLEFYVDSVNGPGTWKSRSEEARQLARDNAWTISRQATDTETIGKEGIAALKMPVLLIGGEKSPPMFARILDAAREALPTAERETLPDAAHPLNRDQPAAFDGTLLKFLTK